MESTGGARPLAPGRRIGDRYLLDAQIGSGGTATVWRGRDLRTGRQVCIKLLHPHLLHDAGARDRLRAEAAAAADVGHPAVVPVLDLRLGDAEAAIVFPFIDGSTLASRLAQQARLEPRTAAAVAADIAAALTAAHAHGIVHRDVKPSNILIGNDGRARLFDFGIAHAAEQGADLLTGNGLTVGTLPYMSPEQLAGESAAPANDVWALGVVLYQTLAGRRPYDAATPTELAQAHATPPTDVPDAPRPLLAIAWAAMARNQRDRPRADQVLEALERWLRDGILPAPPRHLAGRRPA